MQHPHMSHSLVLPSPSWLWLWGAAPASLLYYYASQIILFYFPPFFSNRICFYSQLFSVTYNSTHSKGTHHTVSHFPPFFPTFLHLISCLHCTPHIIAIDEDSGLSQNVWLVIDTWQLSIVRLDHKSSIQWSISIIFYCLVAPMF